MIFPCTAQVGAATGVYSGSPRHGKKGANAFGKCVSSKAKTAAAKHEHVTVNAAKQCWAERQADPAAFRDRYGTNANTSNAFGKCVSGKVKHHP